MAPAKLHRTETKEIIAYSEYALRLVGSQYGSVYHSADTGALEVAPWPGFARRNRPLNHLLHGTGIIPLSLVLHGECALRCPYRAAPSTVVESY